MPTRPLKPCNHTGCGKLTSGRYCERHEQQHGKKGEKDRPTAHQRLYDYRWQKARERYLREHPLCVGECKEQGRVSAARNVDHTIPHRGDLELFWDESNWQGLCDHCHNSVKQREERAGGGGLKSPGRHRA